MFSHASVLNIKNGRPTLAAGSWYASFSSSVKRTTRKWYSSLWIADLSIVHRPSPRLIFLLTIMKKDFVYYNRYIRHPNLTLYLRRAPKQNHSLHMHRIPYLHQRTCIRGVKFPIRFHLFFYKQSTFHRKYFNYPFIFFTEEDHK